MEVLEQSLLKPIYRAPSKNRRVRRVPFKVKLLRWYFMVFGPLLPRYTAQIALDLFSTPNTRYSTIAHDNILSSSREFTVQSVGRTIYGRVWDNQGPTILLVHGWESGGLHLGSFVEPLLKSGYRVVIFDGPAHGRSQGEKTNLPDFAEAMLQVIKKMGPVDHLIAHSFGGFASIYLAANYAEEIGFNKMVLICTPNKLTNVLSDFTRFLEIPDRVKIGMYDLIEHLFDTHPEEIECAIMGQQISVKDILVIHDKHDEILPFYHSLEITHAIDNSSLLETENLGHNRLLKNPEVISRVERFLSK
jgi:pimeloyl-ACP methyl ester carboxylesterase